MRRNGCERTARSKPGSGSRPQVSSPPRAVLPPTYFTKPGFVGAQVGVAGAGEPLDTDPPAAQRPEPSPGRALSGTFLVQVVPVVDHTPGETLRKLRTRLRVITLIPPAGEFVAAHFTAFHSPSGPSVKELAAPDAVTFTVASRRQETVFLDRTGGTDSFGFDARVVVGREEDPRVRVVPARGPEPPLVAHPSTRRSSLHRRNTGSPTSRASRSATDHAPTVIA